MAGKCSDFLGDLNGYLDGEISPELCAEIERHIGECRNCRIMIDTLRQTVTLCREGKQEALPPQLENRLHGLLEEKWRKKFKK